MQTAECGSRKLCFKNQQRECLKENRNRKNTYNQNVYDTAGTHGKK